MHGVSDSADDFIVRGPELSPAFYLVNQGFDVWVGNKRGNFYSRNHTRLDPDTDPDFWDFSFTDQATDDQACIEYILLSTGLPSVSYIGFGMGTTTALFGFSSVGEWYRDRVNLFIGISPISKVNHATNGLADAMNSPMPFHLLRNLRLNELFPFDFYTASDQVQVCRIIPDI